MVMLVLTFAPTIASADSSLGTVRGLVRYIESNQRIAGAQIKAIGPYGVFWGKSDREGSYILFGLPSGGYYMSMNDVRGTPVPAYICVRASHDEVLNLRVFEGHADWLSPHFWQKDLYQVQNQGATMDSYSPISHC